MVDNVGKMGFKFRYCGMDKINPVKIKVWSQTIRLKTDTTLFQFSLPLFVSGFSLSVFFCLLIHSRRRLDKRNKMGTELGPGKVEVSNPSSSANYILMLPLIRWGQE